MSKNMMLITPKRYNIKQAMLMPLSLSHFVPIFGDVKKKFRFFVLVIVVAILSALAVEAEAIPIFYVGVGNSTANDVDGRAADKMDKILKAIAKQQNKEYVSKILNPEDGKEVGATEIKDAISDVASRAKQGDLVVFYYEGHGWQTDTTLGKEDKQDDSDTAINKGDEAIGRTGDLLTDDDLASSLKAINDQAHKLVIVDSCYSGGLVGGADDIDRSSMHNLVYLLSTKEGEADCGLYEYPNWLEEAIKMSTDGKLNGDSDGNGTVSLGEWVDYGYKKRIDKKAGGSKGTTGWLGKDPTKYTIAAIPEPATFVLLGIGLICIDLFRRRNSRK